MNGNDVGLESHADSGSNEDLSADEEGRRRVLRDGVEQPSADGGEEERASNLGARSGRTVMSVGMCKGYAWKEKRTHKEGVVVASGRSRNSSDLSKETRCQSIAVGSALGVKERTMELRTMASICGKQRQ